MGFLSTYLKKTQPMRPWVPYGITALSITYPLLAPGYILSVDMVFTPRINTPTTVTNTYPFMMTLHFLSLVVPSQILEKIILLTIFIVSGISAHQLIKSFAPLRYDKKKWLLASYFAGIFYMINPFTYTRLMAGQYELLIAYAILPFLVILMSRMLNKPNIKLTIQLAALFTGIGVVSIYIAGMAVMLFAISVIIHSWKNRHDKKWLSKFTGYFVTTIAITITASSYWLVPTLLGHSQIASSVSGFTNTDQTAFATVPGSLGLIGNLLAMQGFWGDAKNLYLLPQDIYSWWLIPICIAWLLIGLGIAWAWKNQRNLALLFGITGLLGLILAIGGAGTIFAPFNDWLFKHLPFFAGYRESQKFSTLIIVAYVYFGSVGLYYLSLLLGKKKLGNLAVAGLALPLFCAPLLPWGAHGQLTPTEYPKGWYSANTLLKRLDKNNSTALFLPWHLYMPFSFSGDVIANPAPQFFEVPILSSQNPEIGNAHGYYNLTDQKVGDILATDTPVKGQLAKSLIKLHIKYIILAKDYDYRNYIYINKQDQITKIMDNKSVVVYEIT